MHETTGYIDRYGNDICVGDYVKFRAPGLSGRGIVIKNTLLGGVEYMIQDTRKYPECRSRNEGRRYPFYDDAVYTVLSNEDERN